MTEIFERKFVKLKRDSEIGIAWTGYQCSTCLRVLLVNSKPGTGHSGDVRPIERIYPNIQVVAGEIPVLAGNYLKQAIESVHAPDGATMLAGSAVDAMLKDLGLTDGSVYKRIEEAVEQNILTKDMSEWAHSVRLGANRIRHSDKHQPTASTEDAVQAIEFVQTLAQVLYVIPAKVAIGLASTGSSSETDN